MQPTSLNEYPVPVTVKRSYAGLGLFAVENIAPEQFVIEYTGDRITATEANQRGGQYLFEVTDNLTIDGKDRQHLGRYVNHSCDPNTEAEHDEDGDRIYFRACKPIAADEEITCHYGEDFFERIIKPKGCRCPVCR